MSTMTGCLRKTGARFVMTAHAECWDDLSRARALNIGLDRLLRARLFDTRRGWTLVVYTAQDRIEPRRLTAELGDLLVPLAEQTWGHLLEGPRDEEPPPIPSLFGARVIVDPAALLHDEVYLSAGRPNFSIRTFTQDLFSRHPVDVLQIRKRASVAAVL